jgi:hypothetical protein
MFRFTIRDVLWLTVVVAVGLGLGLGWVADHRRKGHRLQEATARWEKCNDDRIMHTQINAELLSKLDRYVPDWKTRLD